MSNPGVNNTPINPNLPDHLLESTPVKQEVTSFGIFSQSRILTKENNKNSGIRAYTAPFLGKILKLFKIATKVTIPTQEQSEGSKDRTFYVNKKSLLRYVDNVEKVARGITPQEKAKNAQLSHPEIMQNKDLIDSIKTKMCPRKLQQLEMSIEYAEKKNSNTDFFKEIQSNLDEIKDIGSSAQQYNEIRALSSTIENYIKLGVNISEIYLRDRNEIKENAIQEQNKIRSKEINQEIEQITKDVGTLKEFLKYEIEGDESLKKAFYDFDEELNSYTFQHNTPIITQEKALATLRELFKKIEELKDNPAQDTIVQRMEKYKSVTDEYKKQEISKDKYANAQIELLEANFAILRENNQRGILRVIRTAIFKLDSRITELKNNPADVPQQPPSL